MGTEASEDGVIWDAMLPADLPAGLTMGETEAAEIGVYVADALGEGGAALGGATLRLGLHNTTAADELAVSLNGTPLGAALCVWLATLLNGPWSKLCAAVRPVAASALP